MSRYKIKTVGLSVAAALLLASSPSFAQSAEALRQSEQILREQQQRRQEDQRRMESQRPPTRLEMPVAPSPTATNNGCWPIDHIEMAGAASMPLSRQRLIAATYTKRCLGVVEVQQILSDITGYYINRGLTTSRAYLPQQDLSSKVLRLEVVEGRVRDILPPPGAEDSLSLDTAFPGVKGKVMNLRDFEQGLDQINRLPSNNATIDIAPGETPGESVITIRNTPSKRWRVNADVDNYGSRSTGQEQASVTAGFDNPIGINDQWSVTYRRGTDLQDDRARYANALNGFVSVPYGRTTLTLSGSVSDYQSKLVTPGTVLELAGESSSQSLAVDHVAYRDQTRKITVSAVLMAKQQTNTIAGNKLAASSRPLTVLDLGASYTTALFGGSANAGLTYSQGVKFFGAHEDPDELPDSAPHAQFKKVAMTAGWSKPFQVADHNLTWSSQLTAQRGLDVLYGTEQISIGGFYTVRGFYEDSLANDTGFYVRNDLSLRRSFGTVWGHELILKPYLALDGGKVQGPSSDTPYGSMLGMGAGLNVSAGNASFDIFTGRPLVTPGDMGRQGSHALSRLSLSF